jgi:hypothetical protein
MRKNAVALALALGIILPSQVKPEVNREKLKNCIEGIAHGPVALQPGDEVEVFFASRRR